MSTTANALIAGAFGFLNVYAVDEAIPADAAADGLARLNRLVGGWAIRSGPIPARARVVTALIANRGSTASPYTIGTGGSINTPRPATPARVTGAAILYTASTPNVERAVPVLTEQQWDALATKADTSTEFQAVYYDPTITAGLSAVLLWPVPTVATNSLVLYLDQMVAEFADLTTSYTFPPGYDEALEANLARRLATPYGRALDAETARLAVSSLQAIGRANHGLVDLPNELATIGARTGGGAGYDITLGNG